MNDPRLDGIRGRLEAIAEELADVAIDQLRASVRSKASERPAEEKRVTQARRAVEKAVHLLGTVDSD